MPTELLYNGYRFYFYAGDKSEPVHVHVERADGYAKIWLEPKIEMKYAHGFELQEKKGNHEHS